MYSKMSEEFFGIEYLYEIFRESYSVQNYRIFSAP